MPTLEKNLKLFHKNKIQKRIYLLAAQAEQNPEEIEKELAAALMITTNQLSYYLKNTSQPPIETWVKIAQILKCSIDDLIELL